jgi:hypothetical protein
MSGNQPVMSNSSVIILLFPFCKFDIFHGKVGAVRIGITQFMKLTLAITIWTSHTLFIPRILSQPFIATFGISNKKLNPNFDMHNMSQHNTLTAIFFVD